MELIRFLLICQSGFVCESVDGGHSVLDPCASNSCGNLPTRAHPNFEYPQCQRPVSILSKHEFFLRPIDARSLDEGEGIRLAWRPIHTPRVGVCDHLRSMATDEEDVNRHAEIFARRKGCGGESGRWDRYWRTRAGGEFRLLRRRRSG